MKEYCTEKDIHVQTCTCSSHAYTALMRANQLSAICLVCSTHTFFPCMYYRYSCHIMYVY